MLVIYLFCEVYDCLRATLPNNENVLKSTACVLLLTLNPFHLLLFHAYFQLRKRGRNGHGTSASLKNWKLITSRLWLPVHVSPKRLQPTWKKANQDKFSITTKTSVDIRISYENLVLHYRLYKKGNTEIKTTTATKIEVIEKYRKESPSWFLCS